MVCLKDFAHITLPEGSCRFDYLLAVCERERLLLDKEEQEDKQEKKGCYNDDDDDDQYYLCGIDLNESLITPSNHTVPDKEEWRKKLMGSFYGNLSWQNVLKSVVQCTARSNIPESVVSHSSGSDDRRASLKKRLLLAVCEREKLLLHKEEQEDKQEKKGCYNDDDADQYYLHLGGVDLNQSLITPSLPDEEEWKKKLMGSFYGCLSWHNNVVVKPVVQSTTLTNTPESVISHSSDEAASLKYDEVVAEKVNNSKKRKRGSSRVPNNGPEPPPELPVEFKNLILQLAGNRAVCVEKLVIQKELTKTDVNSTQNRLSIPARLVREEFLTKEEHLLLCQHNGKNVCSIEVPLITPMMEVAKASLRRWEMKKGKGVSSVSYVIANTWNAIRRRNKFESKMIVQLWAIRVDADLCMALVRLS
nr:B3 domain-containing protein At5g24050-like [Ipomoea batatas]GMC86611.1 B3 domain-containing protein At5g24050-like [Ipomoea batatas]GMC91887.1 B3 domain-containing protein At5g24050-like [Ipomoea batatas]